MRKTIPLQIELPPSGKVIEKAPGHFRGGLVVPDLSGVAFIVRPAEIEGGLLNPVSDAETVAGAFQVTVSATPEQYRQLARLFLSLAELDTTADHGFHEHIDGLQSEDGRTRVDVILRKHQ